jgi:hypothetical protein
MEETTLLESCYQKTDHFVSRRIAGEAVLVPLRLPKMDTDHIYALNETAASAWALLDGNLSLSAVVEQIVADYEVEEAEAAQEVLSLVHELVAMGALEQVS